MSKIIHMDTERVLQIASQLIWAGEELDGHTRTMSRRIRAIPWEGSDRERYIGQFSSLTQRITILAEEDCTLGLRLQREVDEWIQIDQKGLARLRGAAEGWSGRRLTISPLTREQQIWHGIFDPFLQKINDGIHALYKTGSDVLAFVEGVGNKVIALGDGAVVSALGMVLPHLSPGSTEAFEFEIKGDVTIPGAEVDVPASFSKRYLKLVPDLQPL